ncbi:MAG: family 20 glycosylhydrolase [Armatimonadota bacterium]
MILAPNPKKLAVQAGTFDVSEAGYIRIDSPALLAAAKRTGLPWQVTASPRADAALTIGLTPGHHEQGYSLRITEKGMEVAASTPQGAFYGACTLAQILRQGNPPCLMIEDWPDYPVRGVMLDISRDKVPTMETLYRLVDMLSEWKINQLQLYTEHAFAYLAHPVVWRDADPMTGEQVEGLDAYCRERFIELVPNQNSFGHMERWLAHPEYNSLAEAPEGCDTIWGWRKAFSLCPEDARSIPLVAGLYDELLPHFTSTLVNVGLDETVDLGCGRSREACEKRGKGRVYLDYLLKIHRLVTERKRKMMFWGDIIVGHPELIPELPEDVLALEWGYEAGHPFAERGEKFAASGIPFYVCPGTSSWNSLAGRTENCIGNIGNAARNGLAHSAIGLLVTDWGDNGHWQPLSVSYLGLMAGAMAAWNADDDLASLPECLSLHAFRDPSGAMGRAFHDLGNVHLAFEKRMHNSSVPWQMLFKKMPEGVRPEEVTEMLRRVDAARETAKGEKMACPDAEIVRAEFDHAASLLRLSAEKTPEEIAEAKERHELVWLMRNRPGGLSDSLAQLPTV